MYLDITVFLNHIYLDKVIIIIIIILTLLVNFLRIYTNNIAITVSKKFP